MRAARAGRPRRPRTGTERPRRRTERPRRRTEQPRRRRGWPRPGMGGPKRAQPGRIPPTPGRKPIPSSESGPDGPPQRRSLMSTPVPRAGRSAAEAARTPTDGGFAAGSPGHGALPPERPGPGALRPPGPDPGAFPPPGPDPGAFPPQRPGSAALPPQRPGSSALPPRELPDPGEFPTAGGIPPGPTAEATEVDGSDGASVVRSSTVMALGTLASRGTGFLRTLVLAYALGVGSVSIAYNNANTLPNTVYDLMLGGILTSIMVPLLVNAAKRDADGGAAYDQRTFTLTTLALFVLTVVATLAASLLVS